MPPHAAASRDARKWKKAARARRNRSLSSLPARIGQAASGQGPSSAAATTKQNHEPSEREAETSSTSAASSKTAAPSGAAETKQVKAVSQQSSESSSSPAVADTTTLGKSRNAKPKDKQARKQGQRKRSSLSVGERRRLPSIKKQKLREMLVSRNWPERPCDACVMTGWTCVPPPPEGHAEKCQSCTPAGVICSLRWVLRGTGEILAELKDHPDIIEDSPAFLAAEEKALNRWIDYDF